VPRMLLSKVLLRLLDDVIIVDSFEQFPTWTLESLRYLWFLHDAPFAAFRRIFTVSPHARSSPRAADLWPASAPADWGGVPRRHDDERTRNVG
jgi:hypothetical protein